MADSRRARRSPAAPSSETSYGDVLQLPTQLMIGSQHPLTAAAQLLQTSETRSWLQYDAWQDEAWDFYTNLGELHYAITWFGQALSRVRLVVAEQTPGGNEPLTIEDGAAADLVDAFAGGHAGQAAMLKSLGIQLSVPGDAYVVGFEYTPDASGVVTMLGVEPDEDGRVWTVQPTSTMRQSSRTLRTVLGRQRRGWEVQLDENYWWPLPEESLVCRVWDRDERRPWRANSSVRAALSVLREIDMYNRYIIATLVSRVSLNGLLLIPDEVTLPVNPAYAEKADPFMSELLDVMRAAIKSPGSASSAAPVPLRVPGEFIDKFKHLTFSTPMDEKIFEARRDAITRLASSLNLPQEVLTGLSGANHWCTTDDTRILTRDRGWIHNGELSVGDVVLTLNHDTGLSEWQPVLDIYRADVVDEPMIEVTGQHQSAITTLNHRWPVVSDGARVWRTSETLESDDRMVLGAPLVDTPTEPKYTDEFVQLIAWVVTDGTVRRWQPRYRGGMQTVIGQSARAHPENVTEIRRMLTTLFGPASAGPQGRHDDVPRWGEQFHPKTDMVTWVLNRVATELVTAVMTIPGKIVHHDFIHALTRAQLELFVRTFITGDGAHRSEHSFLSVQRDPRRLDALELAATLLGYVTTRQPVSVGGYNGRTPAEQLRIVHPGSSHVLGGSVRVADRARSTSYTGTIWCPVTPNGTWFAQHNGRTFYTGNTAWQLSEDAIKIHISPMMELICGALTQGYLRPMLRAAGEPLVGEGGGRLVVWYHASELTQRPDRSEASRALNEMLIVNDVATRRESGFDESDAPSKKELETMILRRLALQPQVAASVLKVLTGTKLETSAPETPVAGTSSPNSGPGGETGGVATTTPEKVPVTGPPKTMGEPPPPPDAEAAAVTAGVNGRASPKLVAAGVAGTEG